MNREQLDSYLAQKEREYNLRPGEFRAVWQQESSGSTDPSLKGPTLPGNKGKAVGPFQVVPYFHPGFDPSAPVDKQADYAISFYAGSGETPEQRLRRYYGTGTPMKGQPTTDQYVRQVSARMGGYGSQPEQQMPQEQQMDPNAERQQFQPNYIPVPEPMDYQSLPQAPVAKELTGVNKWLANPLTQMGAAIMAASGSPLGAPIGYGVASAASGLGDAQKAENELYELQLKREQARRQLMSEDRKSRMEAMQWNQKQAAMEQLWKLADDYERAGKPIEAAKIRAGIESGLQPETFHASKTFIGPDGKPVTVMTGTQGSVRRLDDLGIPIGYDPETAGQIAYSKGQGGEAGQTGIKTLTAMYDTASNARTALNAVEDVKTLLDKGIFTGRGDELTREVAGWYSWATGKEMPKLSNTEQMRLAVQDIVLPSLANMKGASSDRDVAMLKEYAQGTHMTEAALRGAFDRIGAKYGSEIDRFNTQYENYLKGGNKEITGFSPVVKPSGYIPNPNREAKTPAAPATKAPAAPTPTAQAPKGGGGWGFKRID